MNKRVIERLAVVLVAVLAASPAEATTGWTSALTSWQVQLDNGRIYVVAANMPSNCTYTRAEISTSATLSGSTSYSGELYAFILASYSAQLPLMVVIESGETTCKVYGAKNG